MRTLGLAVPGAPALSLHHHHAVLDEVIAGNVAGARQAMKEHLVEGEQTIHTALQMAAQEE